MKCRNTKVFIRVLPNVKNCWEDVKILQDKKKMYIRSLQDVSSFGNNENTATSYWQFQTDGVFYNDSQIQIYNTITESILERAIFYGNNALILAYGQTGTGKSLTISGLNASYQDRGILPRLISDIFAQKENQKNCYKINVDISYVETRRNYLKDLFVINGPYLEYNTIKKVTRHNVLSEEEAMKLLFIADGRRSVAADNHMDAHVTNAVFTFYITTKSKKIQEKQFVSKIHIVDLVGADRYGYETCNFKSAYDVSTGNLSKTQLEQFFIILSENIPEKTAVFQHLNILIYYIRDTLSTDNIIRFIGHIRSNRNDLVISLSMLRFAQILRGLKSNELRVNMSEDEDNVVNLLEDDFKLLRKELELNSMLNNESLKGNITQERIEHMKSVAEDYLQNKTNELLVLNVCDASTVMKVFKNLYNKLQIERDQFAGAADQLRRMQDDTTKVVAKRDGVIGYSTKNIGGRKDSSLKSINSYDATNSRKPKLLKKPAANKDVLSLNPKTDPSSAATVTAAVTDGRKSSRTSSRTFQRSSSGGATGTNTSKRRSSQLLEILRDDPAQYHQAIDNVQAPTAVPSFNNAWASFLGSDGSNVALYDELQMLKNNARDSNRLYITQVRLLNEYRCTMEARQDDLQKVRMQLEIEYGHYQTSQSSQVQTTSQLEAKCAELLNNAEVQFLAQQEVALRYQSELKLYVQQCNVIKKDLNNKYNIYCKDSYKTVVPALPEPENKMEFDVIPREDVDGESHPDISEMETTLKTKTDEILNKYEQFKQLRNKECDKKRSLNLKNKKWIRSCKA